MKYKKKKGNRYLPYIDNTLYNHIAKHIERDEEVDEYTHNNVVWYYRKDCEELGICYEETFHNNLPVPIYVKLPVKNAPCMCCFKSIKKDEYIFNSIFRSKYRYKGGVVCDNCFPILYKYFEGVDIDYMEWYVRAHRENDE
jgi:hypothetical protein